jgi:hypothetical protein
MGHQVSESREIMLVAGLTWERASKNCWTAEDRFAQYTIFREIDNRWYGHWKRNGVTTDAGWSCPILETFAEYMIDKVRHGRGEIS